MHPEHLSKPDGLLGTANAQLVNMCNKTGFLMTAALNIFFVSLIAKVLDSLNRHAPVGYQDEAGFHFGVGKS